MSRGRKKKAVKWICFQVFYGLNDYVIFSNRQFEEKDKRFIQEYGKKKFLERFNFGMPNSRPIIINL